MVGDSLDAGGSVAMLKNAWLVNINHVLDEAPRTFRSGDSLRQLHDGVQKHGSMLWYMRTTGADEEDDERLVRYIGRVEKVVINPDENREEADELREFIPPEDTWTDYYEASTLHLVTACEKLDEPFHHSELILNSTGKTVHENHQRGAAYVKKRIG